MTWAYCLAQAFMQMICEQAGHQLDAWLIEAEASQLPGLKTFAKSIHQARMAVLAGELSPVCPLGTNAAVATVDQNKVVTTIRNTEVVADATNVLALECVSRRRLLRRNTQNRERVRLCTSHRVVRAQA